MSEAPKPVVEEPVAAPVATETPAVEPVPEVKATEEPSTEAPAATEPATTEEAAPIKEEIKPVEEGVLGYKAPGLLKSFIFQKKFFWFSSEPVEQKSLASYLRGEKPEVANHNAAWASHTGEGLLFFSKKPTEKASPAGVINLSEASEITNEGPLTFHFTIGSHKHAFEASTLAERDNWVSVLKGKITEAKELAPVVKEHDTYKSSLKKLKAPFTAAVATAPKKSTEVKKEEKTEAKEEKKEEKAEAKEEKKEEKKEIKERKSRSASRKRASIFGSIPGFGKKEEKVEAKEETPVVAPTEPAAEAAVVEPTPAVEAPVVAEPVVEAAAPATEEPAAPVDAKPAAPSKRNSIFGTLKSQFSHTKEKKEEAAPAVPAKDAEPVSETAPVIPAVESTEPLAASVVSPATAPVETAPVTNGEAKTETPVVKTDKRKSSLPWLNKKEKPTSDDETEKPKSPFAKLRATVKGKASPKAEKATEKPAEEETAAPVVEDKPEEPVVSQPAPVVSTSTPQVSATA